MVIDDAELTTQIALQVEASLQRWETRADILKVNAAYGEDTSTVFISVTYKIKGTYDPRNLLVPFYVIPHEEKS